MAKVKSVKMPKDLNINSTVDNRERRLELRCSMCPPNKGENLNRRSKYGKKTKAFKIK